MTVQDEATALAQARSALAEGAEVSKRAVAAHRRALKGQMQALEALEEYCKEHGIKLVPAKSKEDTA